ELRPAFAETQRRFVIEHEVERAGLLIQTKLLNQPPVPGLDANDQRIGRKLYYQIAAAYLPRARQASDPGGWGRPRSLRQRTVVRERLRPAIDDWRDAQPHGYSADLRHSDLNRLSRNANRRLLRGQ